jgi:hypothetical protein
MILRLGLYHKINNKNGMHYMQVKSLRLIGNIA